MEMCKICIAHPAPAPPSEVVVLGSKVNCNFSFLIRGARMSHANLPCSESPAAASDLTGWDHFLRIRLYLYSIPW